MTPQTLRRCCFNCKHLTWIYSPKHGECEFIKRHPLGKEEILFDPFMEFDCPHFKWLPMPEKEEVREDGDLS